MDKSMERKTKQGHQFNKALVSFEHVPVSSQVEKK